MTKDREEQHKATFEVYYDLHLDHLAAKKQARELKLKIEQQRKDLKNLAARLTRIERKRT